MSAYVISLINMKGGVGKTTLCVGLAEYLANYMNKKVLVIDIDPQFNATQSLMGKYEKVNEYIESYMKNKRTIRKILETLSSITDHVKKAEPKDVITKIDNNLDIILGDINIIFDTSQEGAKVSKINNFINNNNIRDLYDYIFIDSPPTISLFTDAALIASDYFLVPVKIDHYSVLGATTLLKVIDSLKNNYDKNIKHLGFIYTNTEQQLTQKTSKIKNHFEQTEPFNNMYFFNNQLTYTRDLMVGLQGNIPSSYNKSRDDIKEICNEFVTIIDERVKSE